ncbi:MAG: hypothetical protein G8345_04955 [Magnetococcales bacterium]|nr:hypothetical protein [Magnetococcales bacterium]NGZ26220.1 hypothetical protein [Magnetococcales bacterium]
MEQDEKIAELRRLLESSTELRDPFGYFMDHFGDKKEFIANSSQVQLPVLAAVLKETVKAYFKKTVDPKKCLILEYRPYTPLVHGSCIVSGFLIVFFHIRDMNIGMAALVNVKDPGMTHYCRFRTMEISDKLANFHMGNPNTKH